MRRTLLIIAALVVLASVGGVFILRSAQSHNETRARLRAHDQRMRKISTDHAPAECGLPKRGVTLADANLGFGMRSFAAIDDEQRAAAANTTYSPYSAATAFQMLLNGSDTDTAPKLLSSLCIRDMSISQVNTQARRMLYDVQDAGSGVEMSVANSIWTAPGSTPSRTVRDVVHDSFRGEMRTFQPNHAAPVNRWISQHTKRRVRRVIADENLTRDTRFLVINALAFDGSWADEFGDATPQEFTFADGSVKEVPMLRDLRSVDLYESDAFDAVRIPYGADGRFGMVLVVPRETSGLDSVIDGLDAAAWKQVRSGMDEREVDMAMPRVKLQQTLDITRPLLAMGIPRLSYGSLLKSSSDPIGIGFVKQGTMLEVDEHGTKAAAATVIGGETMAAAPSEHPEVIADHPYLMVIEDTETGAVIMMSAVRDPLR